MTWLTIYRSQIEALEELNTAGATVVGSLRRFYDSAAKAAPDFYRTTSFESWVHYMNAYALIRQDGNIVQITVRGKDFLKYLVTRGRSKKQRLF